MSSPPSSSAASGVAARAYERLADDIRRGVHHSKLPSERDLAAQLGVSRMTLRQALIRLADEGMLRRSAKRGWYVAAEVLGEPPSVLQSFTEMASARGLRPRSRILRLTLGKASLEEADRLRIAPAAAVLRIDRVRSMDAVPVCVDSTVVVASRVEALHTADLTDRSLYAALEECGVAIARSAFAVQATAADAETAALLELDAGDPVLVGSEVTYDTEGVPVLTSVTQYRGDAYRFQADLFRQLP
ncbi:MAG: UTRA domain-containing protein [Streptosporangiales bacterium]|nr:UTRA domain-containing protein [Streptosporangiales bacterium]